MICDAHVHMGYFARRWYRAPHYYSPRRVYGVLRRCGIDEFIVSSTCAQIRGISLDDLNREAAEMRRIAGMRAHVFLWVSKSVLESDGNLLILDSGLYEGLKLHEGETHWVEARPKDLRRVLSIANERRLPVQFHSASVGSCRPSALARYAETFSNVRFDFAHCPDSLEMSKLIADHPNIWTDTAYMPLGRMQKLSEHDWRGRLMFGSDLPVWQAHETCSLTERCRAYISEFKQTGINAERAFNFFLGRDV